MKRLLASLLLTGLAPLHAEEAPPDVLLIVVDDLNDWIGCLDGHPDAKTPHMDALAARGTLFTNAHCQAPICGPSRASFLSGLYPSTTGLYGQPNKMLQDDTETFVGHLLPQHFARHGYRTFGVGKITHGIKLDSVFDVSGSPGNSGPKPPKGARFQYHLDLSIPYTGTQTDWGVYPERNEDTPDFETATWAVEKLQKKHSQPFFMAVGFHRPHVPFYAPQEWFDLFPLEDVTLPEIREDDLDDVPEISRAIHELPRYPQWPFLLADDADQLRRCTQAYLACTSFVDAQIGKVVEAAPQGTIIVLISDHGYHLGEKNRVAKHSLWPESTRVPMVIVDPQAPAGQRVDAPVGLIDVFPTLCALTGVPAKAGLEGLSLAPLLTDPEYDLGREAIRSTYARGNHSLAGHTHHSIHYQDGTAEYYDLEQDPMAWNNLAPESEPALSRRKGLLPENESPYHPASDPKAVNAWFESVVAPQIPSP